MNGKVALGVAVALTLVAIAWWYKSSTKLSLKNAIPVVNGSLVLTVAMPSGSSYTKYVGKKIMVSTASLGKVESTVCSAVPGPSAPGEQLTLLIATAANAYNGNGEYTFNPNDYVFISGW